jgi:hypothetical protein
MEAIASVITAFVIGTVAVVGATVTGQQEALCKALGGTYKPVPAPQEVCPGGKWSNLVLPRPVR